MKKSTTVPPRVWNKRLALSLNQLEAGAAALAARTASLAERLDTHARNVALAPITVRPHTPRHEMETRYAGRVHGGRR